jgi:anaerobic selenocysteine-containing dehydrogenase
MVASYRDAPGAALYCSTGLNQGSQGTLAFWLLNVINAASGNLDRDGGVLVSRGIVDMPRIAKRIGFGHGRARSRIGGYAQVLDTLPAGVLPDEITTPGDGQIRAMVVTAGNPVLSCPDEARMREALGSLELLVSIDLFRNETGSLAHFVLPALSFLERPDVPIGIHGMQPVPYLQYTDTVVEPDGEQRDEWWIYAELAHAAGLSLFGSRAARAVFAANRWLARLPIVGARLAFEPEKLARGLARAAGTSLQELRERPSGVLLPPNRGETFLGRRVLTDDGRVDLAPREFVANARTDLGPAFEAKRARRGTLELISRRERTTHNTWMHNVARFVEGDRGTNYLYMHPDDAARVGVRDGGVAEISANGATVRAAVRTTRDLARGTVTLPHGWGHATADGLRVAQSAPGVNPNRLAKSGPDGLERLAGMTHLNGIPVDVRPAD